VRENKGVGPASSKFRNCLSEMLRFMAAKVVGLSLMNAIPSPAAAEDDT